MEPLTLARLNALISACQMDKRWVSENLKKGREKQESLRESGLVVTGEEAEKDFALAEAHIAHLNWWIRWAQKKGRREFQKDQAQKSSSRNRT